MNSRKVSALVGVSLSALLLVGCGKSNNEFNSTNNNQTTTQSKKSKGFQTTGQAGKDQYQGVIENGRYRVSKSRGVGVQQDADNMMNLKSFDTGMTDISKKFFSPKDYIFQEGQYLTTSTVEDWLGRKSKNDSEGLNPPDNGSNDPKKRAPMYIQQIGEQDYMKNNNGKLSLAGMTIGIGMNQKDYYQKEKYGPTFTQSIPKDKMEEEGKIAAKKVLERVRKIDGVGNNTPIVIAMFEQAPNDSLVGGTFYAYTVSNSGTNMDSWKKLDIKNYTFPATSTNSVPNANDEHSFENFRDKVQNFFPNLAGVTAQAQYDGDTLEGMDITITTQFYSETEITSFTQYVAQAAQSYLPNHIPIDIQINGSDGKTQAFLARNESDAKFYTHVFNGY